MPRIYLDNAATSWPKPASVYEAVDTYLRDNGAPAGRSTYAEAEEVERGLADCRRRLAALLGAAQPQEVAFAFNGTDALNMALHGLLQPGDHAVTTAAEHNSVLRPLQWLSEHAGVTVTRVACDADGVVDAEAVADALQESTRLVALTHVSNVTGAIQPVADVSRAMSQRQPQALLLVDAAQSLGHLPVHIGQLGADLLAAPGHKGLNGPLGTGLLYVGPRAAPAIQSLRQGGTGTRSEEDRQPTSLPDQLESGNHNVPGLLGLRAALVDLEQAGLGSIRRHELQLTEQLLSGLQDLPRVTVHGPPAGEGRTGVVSISGDFEPQELAMLLDSSFRVQVRAGLHCAPRMHRALNTAARGGTVRFSMGRYSTPEHIEAAVSALTEVLA